MALDMVACVFELARYVTAANLEFWPQEVNLSQGNTLSQVGMYTGEKGRKLLPTYKGDSHCEVQKEE